MAPDDDDDDYSLMIFVDRNRRKITEMIRHQETRRTRRGKTILNVMFVLSLFTDVNHMDRNER